MKTILFQWKINEKESTYTRCILNQPDFKIRGGVYEMYCEIRSIFNKFPLTTPVSTTIYNLDIQISSIFDYFDIKISCILNNFYIPIQRYAFKSAILTINRISERIPCEQQAVGLGSINMSQSKQNKQKRKQLFHNIPF